MLELISTGFFGVFVGCVACQMYQSNKDYQLKSQAEQNKKAKEYFDRIDTERLNAMDSEIDNELLLNAAYGGLNELDEFVKWRSRRGVVDGIKSEIEIMQFQFKLKGHQVEFLKNLHHIQLTVDEARKSLDKDLERYYLPVLIMLEQLILESTHDGSEIEVQNECIDTIIAHIETAMNELSEYIVELDELLIDVQRYVVVPLAE